ncbi:MAG: hypothetical protein MJZ14_05190 [Paludibacteraceae bacterium]|nr:hypothetical protein [Paludibacteraceae bacterium]
MAGVSSDGGWKNAGVETRLIASLRGEPSPDKTTTAITTSAVMAVVLFV